MRATQIDQILITKKFLEERSVQTLDTSKRQDKLYQGIGTRQISEFLGKKNWSETKVKDLLK